VALSKYGRFRFLTWHVTNCLSHDCFAFLERQADLEDLDRVELEFRVQAVLDSGGLAKAVLPRTTRAQNAARTARIGYLTLQLAQRLQRCTKL
jgi:hypothetical protein